MVGVVQSNGDTGKALGLSRLCSGEDDILHAGASKLFDLLLSQHPAHCVRNIALSAAVRSHNTGNSVMKFKYDLVGK